MIARIQRLLMVSALLIVLFTLSLPFAAAAPGNDNFDNRIVLVSGTSASGSGNNVSATSEAGEPGCYNGLSVWWEWTPTVTGTFEFNLQGSNYDTALAVYSGNAVNALSGLGCNDDYYGLQSRLVVNLTAGTSYKIRVSGFSSRQGNISLNIFQLLPAFASTPASGGTMNLTASVGSNTSSAINMRNTGTGALNISAAGGVSAPISVNPANAFVLNAGGNTNVNVICTPTVVGTVTQILSYTTNDTNNANVSYTVNCTGIAPGFSSNPSMGSAVTINTTPGTPVMGYLRLSNTGSAAMNVGVSIPANPTTSLSSPNSYTLAPGASATVELYCNASSEGSFSTTLTVTHDANNIASPVYYTVVCNIGYELLPAPFVARINDTRENAYDLGAPVAVYCDSGAVNVYTINSDSTGTLIINATASDISDAGVSEQNTLIEASADGRVRLYRLTTGEYQIMAATAEGDYIFIWNECAYGEHLAHGYTQP